MDKLESHIENILKERYFSNEFSEYVWKTTYKHKQDKSPFDTFRRVAKEISKLEKNKAWEDVFFEELYSLKLIPGGRILSNAGVEGLDTTLYNCFVSVVQDLSIKDPDSIDGIYTMLAKQAHTLKSEGGYGTNISWIRPEGSYVRGIGSRTPGPLKFLELWDKSSEIITAGSIKTTSAKKDNEKDKIRKGAQMIQMEVWHPDIKEFITAKQISGRFTKCNMSVAITEGFMGAVENDLDWQLIFPDTEAAEYTKVWDGNIETWKSKGLPIIVYETLKAKDLWNLIMDSTYGRNEPGVFFIDLVNRLNPISYAEDVRCTNPCQPGWAKILTPEGIRELKEINIGDLIWSSSGWTKVVNKWSNGIKDVYAYETTAGRFIGTTNHKLMSGGKKIEADECLTIDVLQGPKVDDFRIDPQDVMDGLVLGDGSVHKASNNLVHLLIGDDDQDYFDSEITHLIGRERSKMSLKAYEITTTITADELPKTYDRVVPERFYKGSPSKVMGFLRGLYSANGSWCGKRITLKTTSIRLLHQVRAMLSSIGIQSYYTVNKPKKIVFSNGEYDCRESYDLNITGDKSVFAEKVGFLQVYKMDDIEPWLSMKGTKRKTTFEIKTKKFISTEEVFDITVDNDSHTYWSEGCNISNCGEVPMSTGVCCLASVNLTKFISKDENNKFIFDFEEFSNSVSIGIRFLDDVLDVSKVPLEEYGVSVIEKRRIGLGVLGLGSVHYMLGIRYGSQESLMFIKKLFKTKATTEILTSAFLGEEKGSFQLFDKEKHFNTHWWNMLDIDDDVKKTVEHIGCMRNSHHSMNAPTGNTGILADNASGGIEPVFMKEYIRWSIVNEKDQFDLIDRGFNFPIVQKGQWFETENLKFSKRGDETILSGEFEGINYEVDINRGLTKATKIVDFGWKFVEDNYSKEEIESMKKDGVFVTTEQLTIDDHCKTLGVISHYTNQACSKTINIPNDYSRDDFDKVYKLAYSLGIKGITTYRSGTMTAVLESAEAVKVVSKEIGKVSKTVAPKRPKSLPGEIFTLKYRQDNLYVVVAFLGEDVYEVFAGFNPDHAISHSKGNIVKKARGKYSFISDTGNEYHLNNGHSDENVDVLTRLTSCSLRHGCPIEFIIDQLQKTEGSLLSFAKILARTLKKYVKNNTKSSDNCPECGEKLIYLEGCKKCNNCQWTACS